MSATLIKTPPHVSGEHFRNLVDSIEDYAIYMLDSTGRVVTWNLGAELNKGYSASEVIGRHFRMFFLPEDIEADVPNRELESAAATGRTAGEGWRIRKNGERFWASFVLTAIHDSDGFLTGFAKVTHDQTEKKRQDDALLAMDMLLRKSEKFLQRIGEVAGIGGWEVDLATSQVNWSEETYRLLGAGPGHTPTLENGYDQFPPESRQMIIDAIELASAGGGGWDLQLPIDRLDGRRIWARTVGTVESQDGKPVRITGAFQDITAQVSDREALRDAMERLSLATESGGVGVWDWDIATGVIRWDLRMHQLYGTVASGAFVTYETWKSALHPDDADATVKALFDGVEGKKPYDTEFRVILPHGEIRNIRATARIMRDEKGLALRAIGANWDVTEHRRLVAELAEQHELLRVTLKSIGDGVITADLRGNVTSLNPVAERMTGWTVKDAVGLPVNLIFQIIHEETRKPAENPVDVCLSRGEIAGLANHTILISRHGGEFGIEDSAAPIRNDKGELLGAVLVFHDVTEQRRLSGEMTYRATHDPVTGLINRAEFEIRLRQCLHEAQIDRSQHALLFIDLDEFKIVNDTCGHAVGDQLLTQVSKLLSDMTRAGDTVARLGGDEFAILLEHCPEDVSRGLAQQICDRMDVFRFVHDDQRFRVTASIGLVTIDDRWTTTAAVQQAADASCYAAKQGGRNRVHSWLDTEEAVRERHGQTKWATRIAQALDDERFVLFAQSIKQLNNDAPERMNAEVLLRMVDPDGSLIAPGAFLPSAERFHLVSRIDRWVLTHVLEWMNCTSSFELIGRINVNLSGQSVGDRAFHRWAIEKLAEAGPDICGKLCIEITETAAVANFADAALFIQQLHEVDVMVALDDFGVGSSYFGYLKNMPVDYLKIDGQFIRDLTSDPLDEVAVRSFIEVAKVANIKTVAEFVENSAVLDRLCAMGVDFAQGFYIHRPEPIEDIFRVRYSAENAMQAR